MRDRTEAVDFAVRSEVVGYDPQEKTLRFKLRTISKDGKANLTDMAFPNLHETVEFAVRSNGQVLQAGQYPPQSIFFVPSLPIPDGAVRVGDTWNLEHTWYSARENIPLRLNVVAILKDIKRCLGEETCADIEISGRVNLAIAPDPGAKFESRIWGRLLFSLKDHDVIWSETRSREEVVRSPERVVTTSCMISHMRSVVKSPMPKTCDPKEQPVTQTPKI